MKQFLASLARRDGESLVIGLFFLFTPITAQCKAGPYADFSWTPARLGAVGPWAIPSPASRPNVYGIDAAFIGSYSSKVIGLQIAPLTFASESDGVRLGVLNLYGKGCLECSIPWVTSRGISVGLLNIDEITAGASLGVFNASQKSSGIQLGLINLTEVGHGFQLGVYNRDKPVPYSPITRIEGASGYAGLSVALMNDSSRFRGVQIGIVNQVENGSGVQLGIVNDATSSFHGIQIGLVNLINDGHGPRAMVGVNVRR